MMVTIRQNTYESFIEHNITPENGCVCFIKRNNPRKNFFVIGDGEHTFIELAKPNPIFVLYVKIKSYFNIHFSKKEVIYES